MRRVKEVMGRWEERNNEDKEEVLEFGTEEGDEVRILGSWMGEKEDVRIGLGEWGCYGVM